MLKGGKIVFVYMYTLCDRAGETKSVRLLCLPFFLDFKNVPSQFYSSLVWNFEIQIQISLVWFATRENILEPIKLHTQ